MEIIRLLDNDLLAVFSTCEHWLRTVPTIEPDPDNQDDIDSDAEDHAWDATRQGLVRVTSKPDELTEALEGGYDRGGATLLQDGRIRIER